MMDNGRMGRWMEKVRNGLKRIGIYYCADGGKYEGQFKEDKKSGRGN